MKSRCVRFAATLIASFWFSVGCVLPLPLVGFLDSLQGGQEAGFSLSQLEALTLLWLITRDDGNDGSSSSCATSPTLASALPTGTFPTGFGSIQGKFVSQSGAPVVSAVVMLDDNTAGNDVHYSTHASIQQDGTFAIAGVPSGINYRLAIEPLDTDSFSGRIDTHIDCFLSPSSFTAGWWSNSGDTITSTAPAAGITLTDQGTLDIGTIKLLE